MPFAFPLALEVTGRRCVVIGGGPVAEAKVRALLDAGAAVVVIAAEAEAGVVELARRGEIQLIEREYRRGDLAGALLAFATGDRAQNGAVFAEAEAESVLCNAHQDTAHCHFASPTVTRRGDLVVAVSTGGRAPTLAGHVRDALAAGLPDEFGALIDLVAEIRGEGIAPADTAERGRLWRTALDCDVLGLLGAGQWEAARRLLRGVLAGTVEASPVAPQAPEPAGPATGGWVSIVGAGPGDPDLITVRGRAALAASDIVVHDRLVHPDLFAGRVAVDVGKEPGRHPVPQEGINALLVSLARQGKRVVRLKGGDPFLFGRGSEEAEALAAAGVGFEVVPAPTSALAALAYAGIPATDRRYASSIAVVTGQAAADQTVDWERVATATDTLVVLMGFARLGEIVARLMAAGRAPQTPAAVVSRGTLPDQQVVGAALADIPAAAAAAELPGPALLVVGDVVRLSERIAWFGVDRDGDGERISPQQGRFS
ncbi:MAG TPA: siroheme synthase CysG [Acidimicrobiia bacterium]|jgi:uroporphyrin-III C-methyltransferase/precorrin-2 dehydrogenase/sirohydrochlorin ferrochelatase|nr:siroheme synthase CysG [Acidimicrobiia bacterium]